MRKTTLLILLKLFLFMFSLNAKQQENPIIILESNIIEDKYKTTDKYKEPLPLPNKMEKKEDLMLNFDASINKEKREIDSLKINVGKKF